MGSRVGDGGAPDSNFHSSTSWPGPSELHVIPKQDQPTPEPEIDLEALMELSTEEQKTHLEVESGAGLRVGGTQEPRCCLLEWCGGEPIQRGGFLGGLSGGLWESAIVGDPLFALFHPGYSPKLPPPNRGKGWDVL